MQLPLHSGGIPRAHLCRIHKCSVALCHVMSCHVMSCHVMSCHVMSCDVMSCHVMSCHVMPCHVMSCHVMSPRNSGVLCHDVPCCVGSSVLRRHIVHRLSCQHPGLGFRYICMPCHRYGMYRRVLTQENITSHCCMDASSNFVSSPGRSMPACPVMAHEFLT